MARAGLGKGWTCLFANDFDQKKCRVYAENWRCDAMQPGDIRSIETAALPERADLVWASFPCQDLSLAGAGAGLRGDRSGTFWPFWHLMKKLDDEGRAPSIIALENVCGTLNSHKGKDFAAIGDAFDKLGYKFGALVIDAAQFVPQSRPRLFIIGVHRDVKIPDALISDEPCSRFHTRSLRNAYSRLSENALNSWVWWKLPTPRARRKSFAALIEDKPESVSWHTNAETTALLAMMSPLNIAKVHEAQKKDGRQVGAIYKRTRRDEYGRKVQRAEIRFDDLSGCLRTPAGGSSRQLILVVDGRDIRSRLISSRETARLMGLPDSYLLPKNYNEAYHLTGDGVAVPVVRFIAKHLFEPMLAFNTENARIAA